MGKFISVFVASIQYAFGIYVFKKPDLTASGPLLASFVVLVALFLVLWSLPIYPRRLRKLISFGNVFAQYVLSTFLIEYIMGCFWFPLEAAAMNFLPKTAAVLEDGFISLDVTCQAFCETLRADGAGIFMSYLTSFVILIATMHATRTINLTLLVSKPALFANDISKRLKKKFKQLASCFTMPNIRSRKNQEPDYCQEDFEFEPGYDAMDDRNTHYRHRY